jgi:predicted lipoprotein with Yx(FWY)xxD motif
MASSAAQITTKNDSSLGTILAGDKNLTVYLFEADKGSTSTCNGQCAVAWPPVLTTGNATAAGSAKSSKLGTTKRSDGKMQVTYAGHPLYYFVQDKDAGDAYGQGVKAFGAEWYVMSPSGTKVEKKSSSAASTSSSSSSSSSGNGGY